jgi:hypothetical protein
MAKIEALSEPAMQTYFFDINWNGEMLQDDDGASHFDEGSALYYARVIANRLARGADEAAIRIHVRMGDGRPFAIVSPTPRGALPVSQVRVRAIVERDLSRQKTMDVAAC